MSRDSSKLSRNFSLKLGGKRKQNIQNKRDKMQFCRQNLVSLAMAIILKRRDNVGVMGIYKCLILCVI